MSGHIVTPQGLTNAAELLVLGYIGSWEARYAWEKETDRKSPTALIGQETFTSACILFLALWEIDEHPALIWKLIETSCGEYEPGQGYGPRNRYEREAMPKLYDALERLILTHRADRVRDWGVAWFGHNAQNGTCHRCQRVDRVFQGYNGGAHMGRFCAECKGPVMNRKP